MVNLVLFLLNGCYAIYLFGRWEWEKTLYEVLGNDRV
jgi:hypothetical protein